MNTQNSEQQVKHGIFPFGEKNERYADVFVGQSYLAGLAAAPDASATVAHVSFEPACRNNWHIHTDGYQILLVTGGEGWYQEHGSPARSLQAGDVVVTNKGVKHWHGAKKTAGSATSPLPQAAPSFSNPWTRCTTTRCPTETGKAV